MGAFYIMGGLLAAWALLVSFLGVTRENFPGTRGGERAVVAISVVLTLAAIGAASSAPRPRKRRSPRAARKPRSSCRLSPWRSTTAPRSTTRALEPGTPVYDSDEIEVGTLREVLDNYREHIFDGIVLEDEGGELAFRGRARGGPHRRARRDADHRRGRRAQLPPPEKGRRCSSRDPAAGCRACSAEAGRSTDRPLTGSVRIGYYEGNGAGGTMADEQTQPGENGGGVATRRTR